MEMINYDSRQPWEDLGNAIITQAADDYKKALKTIQSPKKGFEKKIEAVHSIHSINRFFRGKWYGMLTQVDPEYLIQNLNKMYGNTDVTEFVNKYAVFTTERI